MNMKIRRALREDCPRLLELIKELEDYFLNVLSPKPKN